MKRTFIIPNVQAKDAANLIRELGNHVTRTQDTCEGLEIQVLPTCDLHHISYKGHNLRDLEERYIIENSVAYQELLKVAETIISRVQEGTIRSQKTYRACLRAVAFSQLSQELALLVQNMDWYYGFSGDSEAYKRGLAQERELRALAEKEQKLEQVLVLAPDDWSFSV